jgi:hypothetical protein
MSCSCCPGFAHHKLTLECRVPLARRRWDSSAGLISIVAGNSIDAIGDRCPDTLAAPHGGKPRQGRFWSTRHLHANPTQR